MKLIISESQYKELVLTEASKRDILVQKLGLSEINAETISRLCGPLSVWITNKIIDITHEKLAKEYVDKNMETPDGINHGVWRREDTVKYLNGGLTIRNATQHLTNIMDYVRVGLNGDISSIRNLTFDQIVQKANQWHSELNIKGGDLNYVEQHKLILDFRQNGIGYYWVDLETNTSDEECNRMGHCGRTSYGNTIYSLREATKINDKYTMNKSVLTAAIGDNDGIIYQLKGQKNSKPAPQYFQFIVPLFNVKSDDGFLIKGFGSEYNSANDFKITDLTPEEIKKIHDVRPDLFAGRRLQRTLMDMGLIPNVPLTTLFTANWDADDVKQYVDGDWVVRRYKNKEGRNIEYTLFDSIISGEVWELWDNYDPDWKSGLYYNVDENNKKLIWKIVKMIAKKDGVDITDLSLEDIIEEVDDDHDIRNALGNSINVAEANDYVAYLDKILIKCLEEYGTVEQMNDEGVKVKIDLEKIVDKSSISNSELDEYYEACNDKPDCVFGELVGNSWIDKPKFSTDDRWYPDIDNKYFNELLKERLSEIV